MPGVTGLHPQSYVPTAASPVAVLETVTLLRWSAVRSPLLPNGAHSKGDLLEDRAVMVHSMLSSDGDSTGRFGSVADPAGVFNRDVTAMLDAPPCRPSQRVAIPAAPSAGGAHDWNTLYLPGNGTVGGHLGMGSRRNGTTAIHAHGRPQDRRRAEHTSLLLRSGRRVRARPSCSRRESATACPFPNPS